MTWRTPLLGSYCSEKAQRKAEVENIGLPKGDRLKALQFIKPGHWRRIAHVFKECPRNLTRVQILLRGKDGRSWAGAYGVKFSSPHLHFLPQDKVASYENGDGVPHYAGPLNTGDLLKTFQMLSKG